MNSYIETLPSITGSLGTENVPAITGTLGLENLPTITGALGEAIVVFNDYVLTLTRIDGGSRLTITKGSEVQNVDIMDGHTPVKGQDYWTAEDQAEMKRYAADAIEEYAADNPMTINGNPPDEGGNFAVNTLDDAEIAKLSAALT